MQLTLCEAEISLKTVTVTLEIRKTDAWLTWLSALAASGDFTSWVSRAEWPNSDTRDRSARNAVKSSTGGGSPPPSLRYLLHKIESHGKLRPKFYQELLFRLLSSMKLTLSDGEQEIIWFREEIFFSVEVLTTMEVNRVSIYPVSMIGVLNRMKDLLLWANGEHNQSS